MSERVNYTMGELKEAILYSVPDNEYIMEVMTIPQATRQAGLELFLIGDMESMESQIVRQALLDLRERGVLKYETNPT